MSAILVDLLVGFMLVLFAVMALGPLLLSARSSQPTVHAEDRVISVSPVPMTERRRPLAGTLPHPLGSQLAADAQGHSQAHDRRHAA